MSLERFHHELKKQFPSNGGPRIDKFIYILFNMWNEEITKRSNFIIQPKIKNMPTCICLIKSESKNRKTKW